MSDQTWVILLSTVAPCVPQRGHASTLCMPLVYQGKGKLISRRGAFTRPVKLMPAV